MQGVYISSSDHFFLVPLVWVYKNRVLVQIKTVLILVL